MSGLLESGIYKRVDYLKVGFISERITESGVYICVDYLKGGVINRHIT